ncbi:MAG: hypothetical protein J7L44_02205 [Candidatus Diapherotrites archaeon]|nr:hypothetical protein [Candidatus Diapherotrites archaeon]
MEKWFKLLVVGVAAFFVTLLLVMFLQSMFAVSTEGKPVELFEKIDVVSQELVIENGSFDSNLLEIPMNTFVRLYITNRDYNKTHQIILLQHDSKGSFSVIERRSIRSGSAESINLFNYEEELASMSSFPRELFLSCTTCKDQTLVKIVAKLHKNEQ